MQTDLAQDLPSFVLLSERLIDQIVAHAGDLLPEELCAPAQKAWQELQRKERRLVAEVRDLPSVTLDKVGLTEQQLAFKLATYNHIARSFRDHRDLCRLKLLLQITGDILGALVEVLTGAEPLRIMKDTLESGLDALCCTVEPERRKALDDLPAQFDF